MANTCIEELVNLISQHAQVLGHKIDQQNGVLVICLKEQLGVYDIEIYNSFLISLKEKNKKCESLFNDGNLFYHKKPDYQTIYININQ